MAKFVIAGRCDCPYFAKVELLADQLKANLPHFQVHKITKKESEWSDWLSNVCEKNGWKHTQSPIVWRELVDRGGKGLLVGGCNDFMEYTQCYYGISSSMMTDLMLKIKNENSVTQKEKEEEDQYFQSLVKPIHICITNATSDIAYHLIPRVLRGEVFGNDVEVSLKLLDKQTNLPQLQGIMMEAEDMSTDLLRNVTLTHDAKTAFENATAIFILDEVERTDDKIETLENNVELFRNYANVLNELKLVNTKIVVAGYGPVNMNAHVLVENATEIPKQNIVATSRLLERRSRSYLSQKLKINSEGVKDTIVWGECGYDRVQNTFIDTSTGRCRGYDGAVTGPEWYSRSLVEMVYDLTWLNKEFISSLCCHEDKLQKSLKHTPSLSAATALASLMHDWVQGSSDENEIYSLGVESEGWYGISDCVFSMPVQFSGGTYKVKWDVELKNETKERLKQIEKQIKNEWYLVFPPPVEDNEMKFSEDAEIISSMMQRQSDSSVSIPRDKLDIIKEEAEKNDEMEKSDPEKIVSDLAEENAVATIVEEKAP